MQGVFTKSSLHEQAWRNPKEGRVGCLHQNIFTRKVTDIAFTSDFCNNYSHPGSSASLYLTSPRPRPTRPRVPYLMCSSPSSRVRNSPHTRPDVPVPLSPSHFYTQPSKTVTRSIRLSRTVHFKVEYKRSYIFTIFSKLFQRSNNWYI